MRMPRLMFTLALAATAASAACLPTGKDGDRCSDNADCDDDLVCSDDACADPYGLKWRLTVVSVSVSPHDPGGDTWDSDGNPDPFVVVEVDGTEKLHTQAKTDTLTASFNESVSFTLEKHTSVRVTLFDEDFLFNTPIVTTGDHDVQEDELRAGTLQYAAQTGPSADGGVNNQEVTQVVVRWDLD